MITMKLTTGNPEWPIIQQTPGRKGLWGDCKFLINEKVDECDWWFVVEGLKDEDRTRVPKGHVVLLTGEPPNIKKYQKGFVRQFSQVMTCHTDLDHPKIVRTHQAYPWFVGRRARGHENIAFTKGYDDLKSATEFKKDKVLSVVSSSKTYIDGQRKRLDFAKRLKERLGEKVDLFGRGINEVEDKWDALAPYKYHVALENAVQPDYWTEKITDVYLAGSYPIYYGCPNIGDYFPEGSYTTIDIDDFEGSVARIEKTISDGTYERSLSKIMEARDLCLDKYNMFPMLASFVENWRAEEKDGSGTLAKKEVVLRPEASFGKVRRTLGGMYDMLFKRGN